MINANALNMPFLADNVAQCCITSPPYYQQRDYGLPGTYWPASQYRPMPNLPSLTFPAWTGCLGLEPTPELYTLHMVQVFREVARVLRDDGVLWLNLGDSYESGGLSQNAPGGTVGQPGMRQGNRVRPPRTGIPAKNLLGIPWRIAFALQADGWILRSDPPWIKANAMPESVKDRPTKVHEYIFQFVRSQRYYYDADAVRVPSCDSGGGPPRRSKKTNMVSCRDGSIIEYERGSGRNYRTTDPLNQHLVHEIQQARAHLAELEALQQKDLHHADDGNPLLLRVNPRPYSGAHFAVFPPDLVEPFLLASTSAVGECPVCGRAWRRVVQLGSATSTGGGEGREKSGACFLNRGHSNMGRMAAHEHNTLAFIPQCNHYPDIDMQSFHDYIERRKLQRRIDNETNVAKRAILQVQLDELPEHPPKYIAATLAKLDAAPKRPQLVLDPFGGSGTTARVAHQHRRRAASIELNPDYDELAREREKVQIRLF